MEKTQRIKESVNLVGSVASITGISLLWLKNLVPNSNLAIGIPIYAIASLFSLGIIGLAIALFRVGYNVCLGGYSIPVSERTLSAKMAYIGLAGGVLLMLVIVALWFIFALGWVVLQGAPKALSFQ
jgi:hypothetical protein